MSPHPEGTDYEVPVVGERHKSQDMPRGGPRDKQRTPPSAHRPHQPLVWSNIILLSVIHALAMYTMLSGTLSLRMWLYVYLYGLAAGFGVTGGVHRLWTHRAYKARRPLRYLLAVCFSMAGQNTILEWVRDHRVHHKFTDTDADPHNARRGFFFAHIGWLLMRKHPDVSRHGANLYLSDVQSDPVVQWHTRNFTLLFVLFCYVVPVLIPVLCWGEQWHVAILGAILRHGVSLNFTWLVNSAAHLYGTRPYDKRINSAENPLVSALALGEGWHNYHHLFPWDYKASEHKFLNITTLWLDQFARIGWAYDLKSASPNLVERVALQHGDGSHPQHGEHGVEDHFREVPHDEYMRIAKVLEHNGSTSNDSKGLVTLKRH